MPCSMHILATAGRHAQTPDVYMRIILSLILQLDPRLHIADALSQLYAAGIADLLLLSLRLFLHTLRFCSISKCALLVHW